MTKLLPFLMALGLSGCAQQTLQYHPNALSEVSKPDHVRIASGTKTRLVHRRCVDVTSPQITGVAHRAGAGCDVMNVMR